MQILKKIYNFIINFLLPPTCIACNKKIYEAHAMCNECYVGLSFCGEKVCKICGFDLPEYESKICINCLGVKYSFESVTSTLWYNDSISKIITKYKYADRTEYLPFLAKMISISVKSYINSADLIIPVPMHRITLLKRKFNQVSLIAVLLEKQLKIKADILSLKRIKNTKQQAKLSGKERLNNLKNAFIASSKVKNKNIILIDDIITTGTTINACAKALKRAGANKVYVVSIARVEGVLKL